MQSKTQHHDVFVTGATGFVGHAIVQMLRDQGFAVRALVRETSVTAALGALGVELHTGNLGDPNAIARAGRDCPIWIHTAGERSPRASALALKWINVAGTENVLRAAREVRCQRFVYMSCADVTLANEDRVYWNEDRYPVAPSRNAYVRSKALAEELVLASAHAQMPVVALRPAWLWGPNDASGLRDIAREANAGGFRLAGDGSNLLATTHIDNLVESVRCAVNTALEPSHSRAYYIVDAEFLEAREFFTRLFQAIELAPPKLGLPYPLEYARALLLHTLNANSLAPLPIDIVRRGRSTSFDAQRASTDLKYQPVVTVDSGLDSLRTWLTEQGGLNAVTPRARPPASDSNVTAQIGRTRSR